MNDWMWTAVARLRVSKLEHEGAIDAKAAAFITEAIKHSMDYQDRLEQMAAQTAAPQIALRSIKAICGEFV